MDSNTWDQRYSGLDLVWSSTPNRWVEEFASELPSGRALDIAGGEGRNALWLIQRGWQATVVDFSAVALQRARALADERFGAQQSSRLTTVLSDLQTYTPEPRAFDLVIVAYLQVTADLRRRALRQAASAVADGGSLLIIAHDSTNLKHGFGGPQDPAVLYTSSEVEADIHGLGLAVHTRGVKHRILPSEPGSDKTEPLLAIDALLFAHRNGVNNGKREQQPESYPSG